MYTDGRTYLYLEKGREVVWRDSGLSSKILPSKSEEETSQHLFLLFILVTQVRMGPFAFLSYFSSWVFQKQTQGHLPRPHRRWYYSGLFVEVFNYFLRKGQSFGPLAHPIRPSYSSTKQVMRPQLDTKKKNSVCQTVVY